MLYEISEKAMKLESEGKRIIKLNLGDPDQKTPTEVINAAYEAMKQNKTKYSFSAGEKDLREKLSRIHRVHEENVVVSPGSKWAVFSVMYLLLKDGGNVIVPSPHWTTYELIANRLGAETKFLKTEMDSNWEIDLEKLQNLIDRKTRLIVLNSPNNPTSKIVKDKVLQGIIQIANDRKLTIMSDETYSDISFVKTKSILEFGGKHVLIKSFSKTFAMTGWRIGYSVVKKELADKMTKLNQITMTNVPVFIQAAAMKALELRDRTANKMREEYRQRAELACTLLSKTGLRFTKPDAPFYLFPKLDNLDSEQFTFNLLDKGVAIAPGTAFGDYREHFRIALTVPKREIQLGLETIGEAVG